jgi:hypothetical protein
MGNEGSVPEGQGTDDELEHQARAPPSHSNATQSTMQSRSGGRMINALRRDKNKQNDPGETMGTHTSNGYPMNGDGGSYSTGEDGVMMSQEQQQQYYQQQEMYQIQQQTQMPPNQSHLHQPHKEMMLLEDNKKLEACISPRQRKERVV